MIAAILELVTPASILSSILFGSMIGALYGYSLAPHEPTRFPWSLYTIGVAFVVLITIITLWGGDVVTQRPDRIVAFAVARIVLWSITCLSIPFGRGLRSWIAKRRA